MPENTENLTVDLRAEVDKNWFALDLKQLAEDLHSTLDRLPPGWPA